MQKVILVAAQETTVRYEVIQALRGEEYLVLAVPDGAMALDVVQHSPIALLIIDRLSLHPGGLELCRQLRASAQTAHIPLLLLVTSDIEVAQIVNAGPHVDDFLIKPFVPAELHACVRALLRLDKRNRRKKRATSSPRRSIVVDGDRQARISVLISAGTR